jgi:hypothetical protein
MENSGSLCITSLERTVKMHQRRILKNAAEHLPGRRFIGTDEGTHFSGACNPALQHWMARVCR